MSSNSPDIAIAMDGDSMPCNYEFLALRRLWAAVFRLGLQEAAYAYKCKVSSENPDTYRHVHLDWLVSEANIPGSFVWLCDLFDIDPARARTSWRMKVRELAKQAPKEDV